jgi:competence protein ComEC
VFAPTGANPARMGRPGYVLALLALGALGALDIGARDQAQPSTDPTLARFLGGDDVLLNARVLADSTSRPRGRSTSEAVDVEAECAALIPPAPPPLKQVSVPEIQPLSLSDDGAPVYATMRPVKKPRRRASSAADQTPAALDALKCVPVKAGIRITIYPHETGEQDDGDSGNVRKFLIGERLRLVTRLRPPRNFGNPGAWDYAGYLHDQGIDALGSARVDRVEILSATGSRIGQWRARARRSVLARIAELWPGRPGGLIAAMVIGDRSELRRDVRDDFQRTGVYHILVVSGMNVGIIAAVVFWVLRRLRVVADLTASVLTVLLSCAYALLTDGGAPILRATLTLAIYLGARLLYRESAALNAVGLAALLLLAAAPRSLFDASFQLTFVSVAAIAGIAVPLIERTSLPYRRAIAQLDALAYDLTLPPRLAQFRLDVRLLDAKLGRLTGGHVSRFALVRGIRLALGTFELFAISAIAQCALALLMAVYFHRAVLAGLPANLIVVPLTGILMPAAAAAVALSYLWAPLATPAAWIAGWSLEAILATIRTVGGWRASEWRIAAPEVWVACACVLVTGFCLWAARRNRWVAASGLALLATAAAWVAFVPPRQQLRPGVLEVTAIDVGQADSTLVVTPDGHTLLIDAAGSFGPFQSEFDFGEDVVAPYLWSRGITRLDAVAITHAHSDHIDGMRSIVANFRPRELWAGPNAPDPLLNELLTRANRVGTTVLERRAPSAFTFGGAEFRVLSPPADWVLADKVRNQDSLVMQVSYGTTSALITGDADKKMERRMLAAQPRASLLHVAHNGSATSTSEEFLAAVEPEFAVISVGARNPFHHPRAEVLDRLVHRHVLTYRTDIMGTATFYLDGKKVTPSRPDRR